MEKNQNTYFYREHIKGVAGLAINFGNVSSLMSFKWHNSIVEERELGANEWH